MSSRRCVVAIALGLLLTGCTTANRGYPGYSVEQVWQAMVTAAENPTITDWTVTSNNVWPDEKDKRIEVSRRVRRVKHSPESDPLKELRDWRFEITLIESSPPKVRFVSRGFGVPAQAKTEASRYFYDMDRLLGVQVPEDLLREDQDFLDSMGLDEETPPQVQDPESPDELDLEPPQGR